MTTSCMFCVPPTVTSCFASQPSYFTTSVIHILSLRTKTCWSDVVRESECRHVWLSPERGAEMLAKLPKETTFSFFPPSGHASCILLQVKKDVRVFCDKCCFRQHNVKVFRDKSVNILLRNPVVWWRVSDTPFLVQPIVAWSVTSQFDFAAGLHLIKTAHTCVQVVKRRPESRVRGKLEHLRHLHARTAVILCIIARLRRCIAFLFTCTNQCTRLTMLWRSVFTNIIMTGTYQHPESARSFLESRAASCGQWSGVLFRRSWSKVWPSTLFNAEQCRKSSNGCLPRDRTVSSRDAGTAVG